MNDRAEVAPQLHAWDRGLTADQALAREFESRLVESSTLAVRVAYSVLRNREDAEDVAQEAFAKAYRSFSQLRDRERFRAWLVRMTWRMSLDRQRSNRRRAAREGQADSWLPASAGRPSLSAGADVQVGLEARERAAQLWRAIDALSEKLRIVIVLAGIQEHDIKEVAALLDLPEGTVKSRLFAARQQLKDALSWMSQDDRSR
ncbi:MAG: RNA polymerase sigma factor [Vicinamibacterales bacterium]